MIKALLLDLDVLRIWDPCLTSSVEERYGLPTGALAAAALTHDRLHPALTGVIDHETWREGVARALAVTHGAVAHEAVRTWMSPVGHVDTGVLEVVRAARDSLEVVLLANATTRLRDDLVALGLTDEVDDVLHSAELGLAKPDPDTFGRAALHHGLLYCEMALVDARSDAVAAAEILGIRAHHYQDVAGLREFLAPLVESAPRTGPSSV